MNDLGARVHPWLRPHVCINVFIVHWQVIVLSLLLDCGCCCMAEQQPGSPGTGCSFLYPIIPQCPTQQRVSMSNILLEDVHLSGGLTLPGVLLLNASTPGVNFTFNNVVNTGPFLVQKDYVCQHIDGVVANSLPVPSCFSNHSSSGDSTESVASGSTGSTGATGATGRGLPVSAGLSSVEVGKLRLRMLEEALAAPETWLPSR